MNHARLTAFVILVGGCEEPAPPTPSDSIIVPYQFIIEFELDQDDDVVDPIARARFYDITQAYDLLGNAGTIELTGGDASDPLVDAFVRGSSELIDWFVACPDADAVSRGRRYLGMYLN